MTFEAIVFDETSGGIDKVTVKASSMDAAIDKIEGDENHEYEVIAIQEEGRLD